MDNDCIVIEPGDHFTVAPDPDGCLGVKIQNTALAEDPRWLLFQSENLDEVHRIDELIATLSALRDQHPAARRGSGNGIS